MLSNRVSGKMAIRNQILFGAVHIDSFGENFLWKENPVRGQIIWRWALYHVKLIGLIDFKSLQWINKFKISF